MSVSTPFIHRPLAMSLPGVAVMLGGILGYWWLPISALPQFDFSTIQVKGANPNTIAALVLKHQFAAIATYIVLDVLYTSFIHPLAEVVRLRRLGDRFDRHRLMGIVKKSAILMIDFAIDTERYQGVSPEESTVRCCVSGRS